MIQWIRTIMNPPPLASQVSYSFFFILKNPEVAQDSPAVAIQVKP